MEPAGSAAGLEALQHALGHRFREPGLLKLALTHSSAEGANHQRLEFLGDAILSATVGAALYAQHPDWSEGDLSVARTRLVCQDSLAGCAQRLGLPALVRVSRAVARSGPVHERASVLADTVEALLGAVYLDGGFAAAKAVSARLLEGAGASSLPAGVPGKDPKTRLQEWLQARGWPVPDYQLLDTRGPANALVFRTACRAGRPPRATEGEGRSRKAAEQAAAELMLASLEARADGAAAAAPDVPAGAGEPGAGAWPPEALS